MKHSDLVTRENLNVDAYPDADESEPPAIRSAVEAVKGAGGKQVVAAEVATPEVTKNVFFGAANVMPPPQAPFGLPFLAPGFFGQHHLAYLSSLSKMSDGTNEAPLDLSGKKTPVGEEVPRRTAVAEKRARSPSLPAEEHLQAANGQHRRVRTQMSQFQVNIMKCVFMEYKTPTMNECERLGKEIGLKKRVVQVWFQNARAKEKKNPKNNPNKLTDLHFEVSDHKCVICNVPYANNAKQRVSF